MISYNHIQFQGSFLITIVLIVDRLAYGFANHIIMHNNVYLIIRVQ